MLLNAAVFMRDYEGMQLNSWQGLSPRFENAGDAESIGLELGGLHAILKELLHRIHDEADFPCPGL